MIVNISIKDLFENIVNSVYTVTNPLYFEFGYWPEIANNIKSKGQDAVLAAARYPFLMVSAGFKEKREQEKGIYCTIQNLKLYLIYQSEKGLSTIQRETQIYQALAEPMYNNIIQAIKDSGYFNIGYFMPNEIEKLYYLRILDKNDSQLNDFYDGIEITIDELKVFNQYTCEELNVS